mgnify:FL=1
MNNKGYTLVELLAVIVILALLAGIGVASINNSIKASREKSLELQYETIESTAKSFCQKHLLDEFEPSTTCELKSENCCSKVPSEGEVCYIVLEDLITEGLTEELKDPKNGGYINGQTLIEITYRNNQFVTKAIR